MIKIISMLKRQPHLSTEAFCRYWHDHHAPLARRLVSEEVRLAVKQYKQNHALQPGKTDTPYDGVAEIYFDDMAGVKVWSDWYFSDAGKELRDDEDNFIDKTDRIIVVADEKPMPW